MSDIKSKQEDDTKMQAEKRSIKFTPKKFGFVYKDMPRKAEFNASKYMGKISALMTSHENVKEVSSEFGKFIKCYQDANALQESFLSLPLPEDEVTRQTAHFQSKVTAFSVFMDKGFVAGNRRAVY